MTIVSRVFSLPSDESGIWNIDYCHFSAIFWLRRQIRA